MSFFDIMQMCIRNLYRRKGRTALTVSGVIIGCCAIVIMVSLGIGMKQAQDQMLAQMGNLTGSRSLRLLQRMPTKPCWIKRL